MHTATAIPLHDLPGTVMFLFQPAEEGPPPGEEGGAALSGRGCLLFRPEAVFGLHARAHLDVGRAAYTPGGALAAVDHFRVTIRGRQSHGAAPHLGIDPVVLAAQAVTALQTIRSRTLSPLAPSVVTVGMIHGGTRFNIIPGEVALEGTVRTYDPAVQDTVERRMREILDGVTRAGGGSFELGPDCPGDHQRPGFDRALGSQPGTPSATKSRWPTPGWPARTSRSSTRCRGSSTHPGARHNRAITIRRVPRRRRRAVGMRTILGLGPHEHWPRRKTDARRAAAAGQGRVSPQPSMPPANSHSIGIRVERRQTAAATAGYRAGKIWTPTGPTWNLTVVKMTEAIVPRSAAARADLELDRRQDAIASRELKRDRPPAR